MFVKRQCETGKKPGDSKTFPVDEVSGATAVRIIETIDDAVITIDEGGTIRFFNDSAERVFGYTASEAIGNSINMLMPEPYSSEHDGYLRRYMSTGEAHIIGIGARDLEGLRKDGSRFPMDLAVSELRMSGTRLFVGAVRDITRRKATEAQLVQAQKLEAVGQLTGGLAHDFNNLLTVVIGNLQLMKRRPGNDQWLTQRIDAAHHAAQRGAELTRQLLAMSRSQPLSEQVVDLNEIVRGMHSLLQRTLGETTEMETQLAADLKATKIDPSLFENAVLNLALNAHDAMPDGGRLIIETGNAVFDHAYTARNPDVAAGPYAMLAISDTGVGIPADVIDRIFEPFFTTKEVGKGSGLGLSMIYGFIKQSGGHMQVYSEPDFGTTFRLYFPVTEEAAVTGPNAEAEGHHPRGTETILVVEDDADVRDVTVAMIEALGYRTLIASDGPAALEVIRNHPEIDLLFTDFVMPRGMTGKQLAAQAQATQPDMRVLYTSGYTRNSMTRKGGLEDHEILLSKPYDDDTLAVKIREALD